MAHELDASNPGRMVPAEQGEVVQITIAPGVADALLANGKERQRMQGSYHYTLGDMDISQSALAHAALARLEVDHASPAGYVAFRTAEQRLNGIERIHTQESRRLGWKWRKETGPRPSTSMSTNEWVSWMQSQPIDPEYLRETSRDPHRPGAVLVFFDENGEAYYATTNDLTASPDNNHRQTLAQIHSARWMRTIVEGDITFLGYSPNYLSGHISLDLQPVALADRAGIKPTQAQYNALRVFMGQPTRDVDASIETRLLLE